MRQITYKLNWVRLSEFWIAPILIICFFSFLVYADYEKHSKIALDKLASYMIVMLLFLGPFVWLFFNHLKNASIRQIKFDENGVSFFEDDVTNTITYREIVVVVEYSNNKYGNGKMTWSDIVKWKIKTGNQEFVISSLVISRTNLRKYIEKEFQFEATYFPTL